MMHLRSPFATVRTAMLMMLFIWAPAGRADEPATLEGWRVVRGPDFVIYSDLPDRRLRALTEELVLFRLAFQVVTNARPVPNARPLIYFLLQDRALARRFGLEFRLAANIRKLPRYTLALVPYIRSKGPFDTDYLLRGIYVTHQLSLSRQRIYPGWYVSGFQEYMGSAIRRGDKFHFGTVVRKGVLQWMDWLHLSHVIAPQNYRSWPSAERALYEAETWALYHYLLHDHFRGDAAFLTRLDHYIEDVGRGLDAEAAFEAAFGVRVGDLDVMVRRYLDRYRGEGIMVDLSGYQERIEMPVPEPVTPSHMAVQLGELSFHMGKAEIARDHFAMAQRATDRTLQARALCGQALLDLQEPALENAERKFRQAIALASDDNACKLDFAGLLLTQAQTASAIDDREGLLVEIRELLAEVVGADPALDEAYLLYGQSLLLQGDDAAALDALQFAADGMYQFLRPRMILAEAHLSVGRCAEAAEAARFVAAWSDAEASYEEQAERVLSAIDEGSSRCVTETSETALE